jgi:HPt (histidine-containing phosphotransfer) domain-containing protein
MSGVVDLDVELARLWEAHRGEIDSRMVAIDAAVAQLRDGALSDESRAAAVRAAHQLAGTAGTFGFTEASQHAAELVRSLADTQAQNDAPRLAIALRAALEGAAP